MSVVCGDGVVHQNTDYPVRGIVVGVFLKLDGEERVVVEDDRGLCFIFNEADLVVKHPRRVT